MYYNTHASRFSMTITQTVHESIPRNERDIPKNVCHTSTRIGPYVFIVYGMRASSNRAFLMSYTESAVLR